MISEIGLIFNGLLLLKSTNSEFKSPHQDNDLVYALISAIDIFYKTLFSQDLCYIKGKENLLVFSKKILKPTHTNEKSYAIAYAIAHNNKLNTDEYVMNEVEPRLKEILVKFRKQYSGCNPNEVTKFQDFKKEIDKIIVGV